MVNGAVRTALAVRYPSPRMLLLGTSALGQTLALVATFIGIGVIVNVLIVYVVGQVWGEHQRNQQRRARRF